MKFPLKSDTEFTFDEILYLNTNNAIKIQT